MDHKLYLSDPGIFKKKNHYYFNKTGSPVSSLTLLNVLNSIKVPPAWENVWYASNKRCHIIAHGVDSIGKKQYILSERWINNSRSLKYNRMKSFIKNINSFKRLIVLSRSRTDSGQIDRENLIKLLFNLLIDTHLRVGNEKYAEGNRTYGLTTLRQKHLIDHGDHFRFSFIGKSKIPHNVIVPPEYSYFLRKLILPNKEKPLFWYTANNKMKTIDSEELNYFLKDHMGKEYTCKDFRTWSANIVFINAFLKNSKKDKGKKVVLQSIDESARELGHTRNISRKSYISNTLLDYCLDSFDKASVDTKESLLSKVWS